MTSEKRALDAQLLEVLVFMPGWKLDPTYAEHTWCAAIYDGNEAGKRIHVSLTHAKGRLYVSGIWPSGEDRQQCIPDTPLHITIARDKPAAKIAADIQRRFLPWYTAAYAEQLERIKKHNAARNRQQEATAELAVVLGQEASGPGAHGRHRLYARDLTVQVNHGGESVNIELTYISVKAAKAILRAYVKSRETTD